MTMTGNRTKMDGGHGKYMSVMYTRPQDCGGRCIYCIDGNEVTKSTIPNEDTLMAARYNWSAGAQLAQRCKDAGIDEKRGYKIEFAIKGNSFTNYDPMYIQNFIKQGYDELNGFVAGDFSEAFAAQRFGGNRCVYIRVETRPDQITPEWCEYMCRWGVRMVEIGVQSLNDDVLKTINRGHGVQEVINASRLLHKYGFGVGYQVMLGLYGSTREIDYEMLTKTLWTEDHYPDHVKIYPCVVLHDRVAQRRMYDLYDAGLWKPIGNEEYDAFLKQVLPHIPKDAHVNRLQRIFRESDIALGPKKIIDRTKYRGICQTMWTRSLQNSPHALNEDFSGYKLTDYRHGCEYCIQVVLDDDTLLGYGRLQIRDDRIALLRDMMVLGTPRRVGDHNEEGIGCQHIGIGTDMLRYAEDLAKKNNCTQVELHSSAGDVEYFAQRGYTLCSDGYTMKKSIESKDR